MKSRFFKKQIGIVFETSDKQNIKFIGNISINHNFIVKYECTDGYISTKIVGS
jgi:hypothetical protein